MDIVLATRNKRKAEELKKILKDAGIPIENILTLQDFPHIPEVIEDGKTFEENAIKKARTVAGYTGMITIADDSGLEVDALGGAPGVISARYAVEGDDRANNERLLREMEDVPDDRRTARFVCCIAIASGDLVRTFHGYVNGRIGRRPVGDRGFGYDPLFYPEGYDRTFAEMTGDEKNRISHRAMALKGLQEYLRNTGMK
ncbi:MAG: XTP/dITP diphosphatase [Thermodesulfovibrionia bacterium]